MNQNSTQSNKVPRTAQDRTKTKKMNYSKRKRITKFNTQESTVITSNKEHNITEYTVICQEIDINLFQVSMFEYRIRIYF